MVTLTGAGGVGKTRLAIEITSDLGDRFPDGQWYVDLAPITIPAVVPVDVAGGPALHTIAPRLPPGLWFGP